MKTVAVMQPYFFPYLGYYQLARAVDSFVFLDNVTFIKSGYINRNTILLEGRPHRFSLPVAEVSSFRLIAEHEYVEDQSKFLSLLRHAYAKCPSFAATEKMVRGCFDEGRGNVARVNGLSVSRAMSMLGTAPDFLFASELEIDPALKAAERVIAICSALGAERYVNAPGGKDLYNAKQFLENGIELAFIEPFLRPYGSDESRFIPGLSILDALMRAQVPEFDDLFDGYRLSPATSTGPH